MSLQRARQVAHQSAWQEAPLVQSASESALEELRAKGASVSPYSSSRERLIPTESESALEELRAKYDRDGRGKTLEELLELLIKSGVGEWNSWRKRYPGVQVSLRGAQLNGRDLRGANLSGVDLREARLKRTLLEGANLHKANLHKANLNGATMREANLNGATLDGTKMSRVSAKGERGRM